jgi:hypothetical protein
MVVRSASVVSRYNPRSISLSVFLAQASAAVFVANVALFVIP